jgi:hypothetical protein
MKTRDEFHNLIDKIEDEMTLKGYLTLIQKLIKSQSGELWNGLSAEAKAELLLSYEESFDPSNLVSHEQVRKQHEKWLKK